MSHPYGGEYQDSREDAYEEERGKELARLQEHKKTSDKKGQMAKKMFKAHGKVMQSILKGMKSPLKSAAKPKKDPFSSWKKIDKKTDWSQNLPPGHKDWMNE